MKWIIRLAAMAVCGGAAWLIAGYAIKLPPNPQPDSYTFSALVIIGGNVIFAVLDFFLTQFSKKLDSLASNSKLGSKEARSVRARVRIARTNATIIALISLGLKGIGALTGTLMQQKALALSHYPIAFAIGFATIGAAVPALAILWKSLFQLEQTEENLLRFVENSNDRDALIKSIKSEKSDEAVTDETLAGFGKVIH